jgi:hypothetical protein
LLVRRSHAAAASSISRYRCTTMTVFDAECQVTRLSLPPR